MSRFNWSAFEDPEVPAEGRPSHPPVDSMTNWDFSLTGDTSGLTDEALNAQIDEFIEATQQIQASAAALEAEAWDPNNLVRVTVNAAGVVTGTTLADDAHRRSSPTGLAAAFTAAAQAAAADVRTAVQQRFAPLLSAVGGFDGSAT